LRKRSIGRTSLISKLSLRVQQRSIICCYCLHDYSNESIHTKLCRVYHEASPCLRPVEKWAARFRRGQETVEDDSRPGHSPKRDFIHAVLRYLDKKLRSSSCESRMALCPRKTTISRILHDLRSQFFGTEMHFSLMVTRARVEHEQTLS
jgi:hypothetical protein